MEFTDPHEAAVVMMRENIRALIAAADSIRPHPLTAEETKESVFLMGVVQRRCESTARDIANYLATVPKASEK